MGHLKGILAWVGGNLNNNFQISQMSGGGGAMLKLRFDRYIIKSIALEKCKKMRYGLNILVQGFCPLKIKITQFPDGFRLKFKWTAI